jgi:hypothetical protein
MPDEAISNLLGDCFGESALAMTKDFFDDSFSWIVS